MNTSVSKGKVSICSKDNCLHAYGKNAENIAKGASMMLLLIGVAALIRAASN